MDAAYRLSTIVCGLMAAQALAGLLFPNQYRDVAWITATWFGNDWVTLVVAVPLLLAALSQPGRSGVRGLLLWLGILGYAVYNYAFYLFGAALNVFFLLYVCAMVAALASLILALSHIDAGDIAAGFRTSTRVRLIGATLVGIATGLASIWIVTWAAYVWAGTSPPVEPEAFKVVAALDLSLMVPLLFGGGVLLWRSSPWGYIVAGIASIQGALYVLVLSVNSIVAIHRGLASAPGELVIWAPLFIVLTTMTALLFGGCTQRHRL